jgi:hypothetical protein
MSGFESARLGPGDRDASEVLHRIVVGGLLFLIEGSAGSQWAELCQTPLIWFTGP